RAAVAARLYGAAAGDASTGAATLAEAHVVASQGQETTARRDPRVHAVRHCHNEVRRARIDPHRHVAGRLWQHEPEGRGPGVHANVGHADVAQVDVELSRARVHRERGRHIAGEVYVDVDLAGVAEETLGSDLVDTEVGPCGRTGGAKPQIRIRAVRIHEIGRATADPVVTGAAVYGHAHRGRAAPRRGHIGDPVPAARRKSEEADRGTRRG